MLINNITSICNWMSDEPRQQIGCRVLQIILGVVFLFRVATEIPFTSYLYGSKSITSHSFQLDYGVFVGELLNRLFQSDFNVYLLLMILAGCGVCFILSYQTRLITLISLIVFNLIAARNTQIGDGGDNITQIVLLYMLFLTPYKGKFKAGGLKVWFHNLAVVAIALQIMILYFTAGFMKINGSDWVEGIALYNVSQVETFSLPLLRDLFKNPYITTIASYMTMVFLVWFPIAMFSKFKGLWILIGISFHLGIAGYMGLITFALTMVGLELFFLTDKEYQTIKITLDNIVEKVKRVKTKMFIKSKPIPAVPAGETS